MAQKVGQYICQYENKPVEVRVQQCRLLVFMLKAQPI